MNERSEPIIGICAVKERARWAFWDQEAHLVADSYVSGLQRAGAIAILLPVDRRAPLRLLEPIDGLVLIGGADIDPRSYGAPTDPAVESTYPERDQFELALLRGAIDRELPVLAICRGMQLLNVVRGGTLVQHLPEHATAPGSFERHQVVIRPDSVVGAAVGRPALVESGHHQGVESVGRGLRVVGRAPDGVIEAIEDPSARFCVGVLWHPEQGPDRGLFRALVAAAPRP